MSNDDKSNEAQSTTPSLERAASFDAVPQPREKLTAEASPLSELEHSVLGIETHSWHYGGAKEEAIAQQLGISTTRYYQVLNAILDRREAYEYAPALVARLRRLREEA